MNYPMTVSQFIKSHTLNEKDAKEYGVEPIPKFSFTIGKYNLIGSDSNKRPIGDSFESNEKKEPIFSKVGRLIDTPGWNGQPFYIITPDGYVFSYYRGFDISSLDRHYQTQYPMTINEFIKNHTSNFQFNKCWDHEKLPEFPLVIGKYCYLTSDGNCHPVHLAMSSDTLEPILVEAKAYVNQPGWDGQAIYIVTPDGRVFSYRRNFDDSLLEFPEKFMRPGEKVENFLEPQPPLPASTYVKWIGNFREIFRKVVGKR